MALICKFKEKKTSEKVFSKIDDDNLCFSINQKIEKWSFFEMGKIRELNELPEENCAFRILCSRNINAIEVLDAFKCIDEISCSFATLNEETVEKLNKLKVNYFFGRVNPIDETRFFNPLADLVNAKSKHKITGHVKIFLIKSENKYYTVNTSANPKGSSQFECYTIYNSKDFYDFCLNSLLSISQKNTKNQTDIINYSYDNVTILNRGGITPIDLILKINKEEKIEQLDFVVFSTGVKALDRFSKLNESIVVNFHISDFIIKMKSQKNVFQMIKSLIKKHNGKIGIYNTHCKITLIKTKLKYYVIDSTSNLGSNSKYEITELRNSEKEYIFTLNFINKYFK